MSGRAESERGRWAVAIGCLLTERTTEDAAKKAGVAYSTLRRWLRNPRFLALYRRARRSVVEHAVARLQLAAVKAVDTLERNLTCANPAAENRAAVAILDQAMTGMEMLDVEERLTEVERLMADREKGG